MYLTKTGSSSNKDIFFPFRLDIYERQSAKLIPQCMAVPWRADDESLVVMHRFLEKIEGEVLEYSSKDVNETEVGM